jgi:hypothetical protein
LNDRVAILVMVIVRFDCYAMTHHRRDAPILPGQSCGMKRVIAWVAALVVWTLFASDVAKAEQPALAHQQIDYDIPSQSLASALNAYVLASGVQVLYETAIAEGRRSRKLSGRLSPELGLSQLLAGTGLASLRTAPGVYVITPAPKEPAAAPVHPDAPFLAALQTGLLTALCRSPRTRPGGYHVGIEVWVGPNGVIDRSSLVGSTGDIARDEAVLRALRGTPLGVAPPAQVRQPLFLTISRPQSPERHDCAGTG